MSNSMALQLKQDAVQEVDKKEEKPKRQPTSLQGLLKFAMEATKDEDPSQTPNLPPLDEERKEFLEKALKSMTIDVIEILQKQIALLKEVGSLKENDDAGEYLEAVEVILDYTDNIDIANDFHKIGGFMVLIPCLECANPKVRAAGCELIAVLCQNNPYCQQVILDNEFIPRLLEIIKSDPVVDVSVKAVYAISAIVRNNSDGFSQLIMYQGFNILLNCLKKNNEKLTTKIAFLLTALCKTQSGLKSRLVFLEYVPALIGLITEERRSSHEHVLALLVTLSEESVQAVFESKNAKYNLKEVLQKYLETIKNREECLEEEQYCKRILHLLSSHH